MYCSRNSFTAKTQKTLKGVYRQDVKKSKIQNPTKPAQKKSWFVVHVVRFP
jgi:hypothetical protein